MFDSFLKYQSLVEKQFRRLQQTYKFTILDGNRSPDAVTSELKKKIEAVLLGR
jgi:dTMP kinase